MASWDLPMVCAAQRIALSCGASGRRSRMEANGASGRPQPPGLTLFGQQPLGKINAFFQLSEALLHFLEFRESTLHVVGRLQWLALPAAPPILWRHEPRINDLQDRHKN